KAHCKTALRGKTAPSTRGATGSRYHFRVSDDSILCLAYSDGREWIDVPCEHPLSLGSAFRCSSCCPPRRRTRITCVRRDGCRPLGRSTGSCGLCAALHRGLPTVCGSLVHAGNWSRDDGGPAPRAGRATLVERRGGSN